MESAFTNYLRSLKRMKDRGPVSAQRPQEQYLPNWERRDRIEVQLRDAAGRFPSYFEGVDSNNVHPPKGFGVQQVSL